MCPARVVVYVCEMWSKCILCALHIDVYRHVCRRSVVCVCALLTQEICVPCCGWECPNMREWYLYRPCKWQWPDNPGWVGHMPVRAKLHLGSVPCSFTNPTSFHNGFGGLYVYVWSTEAWQQSDAWAWASLIHINTLKTRVMIGSVLLFFSLFWVRVPFFCSCSQRHVKTTVWSTESHYTPYKDTSYDMRIIMTVHIIRMVCVQFIHICLS